MTRRPVIVGALALFAASALGGLLLARHNAGRGAIEPSLPPALPGQSEMLGRLRPDFALRDMSGSMRHVGEWDGSVLALNFWATWCPPCRTEIPEFVALQDKYRARGLQFVGIALQGPEEVREFAADYGINYPVLVGEMEVVRVAEAYGNVIGALPYTVIMDRRGHIAFIKAGPLPQPTAEEIILALLQ